VASVRAPRACLRWGTALEQPALLQSSSWPQTCSDTDPAGCQVPPAPAHAPRWANESLLDTSVSPLACRWLRRAEPGCQTALAPHRSLVSVWELCAICPPRCRFHRMPTHKNPQLGRGADWLVPPCSGQHPRQEGWKQAGRWYPSSVGRDGPSALPNPLQHLPCFFSREGNAA